MSNWCNLRLVATGYPADVRRFRRAAGALSGRIDTRKSCVFTGEMEYGEGGDLEADRPTPFKRTFLRATYRFQGANADHVEHFGAVSRRYPRLVFTLTWSDPNGDSHGSYLIHRGRARSWEVPMRERERLLTKRYKAAGLVDAQGEVDYDASDTDWAESLAFFDMMDLAGKHWEEMVAAWLKALPKGEVADGSADLKIKLGISLKVDASARDGNRTRVVARDVRGVVEKVVLVRWRKRGLNSRTLQFHGFRLPPGTWWAVNTLLEQTGSQLEYSAGWLRRRFAAVKEFLDEKHWDSPRGEQLALLLNYLNSHHALDLILTRHGVGNVARPGIPDLFLYTTDRTGRIVDAHFVEVKLKDRLLPQQRAEILYLRELGFSSGYVRIVLSRQGRRAQQSRSRRESA